MVPAILIRSRAVALLAAAGIAGLGALVVPTVREPANANAPKKSEPGHRADIHFLPMGYQELSGWETDDHLAAFQTFQVSCDRLIAVGRDRAASTKAAPPPGLIDACVEAKMLRGKIGKAQARGFFETHFAPHIVVHKGKPGVLTAYYEPVLMGSRTQQGAYQTPIYKRPADLLTLIDETKGSRPGVLTHGRRTGAGVEPYFTRAQIEDGALKGRNLELLYFADPVDIFFLQIQGSGRVKLTDGSVMRVQYDGKNGHQYASIGQYLIEKGLLAADKVSLATLRNWLQSDPERGRQVMWQNPSFVFFRETPDDGSDLGPLGALGVPLTPLRSLAVDPAYHALGLPIFVTADGMGHVDKSGRFERLMIAQDVGSAIKGPERGDVYIGSGDAAGKVAGITRTKSSFVVLLPVNEAPRADAGRSKP